MIPKIKICGLRENFEAQYLNENKVEYAGFVLFYPKSKRNISIERANEIREHLSSEIKTVAVVVNPTVAQVIQIEKCGFDYIQVHGKLNEEILKKTNILILRAFNVSNINEYEECKDNKKIAGFVFDGSNPGAGKIFDWDILKKISRNNKLFILAGGLTSENVDMAIEKVSPDIVDVSTSVEDNKGKSQEKIKKFVRMVRYGK